MGVVFPNDIWATLLSRNQLRHNFSSRLRIYLSYDLHTSDSADDDDAKLLTIRRSRISTTRLVALASCFCSPANWGTREPARAFDEALLCAKLRNAWPILIPTAAI